MNTEAIIILVLFLILGGLLLLLLLPIVALVRTRGIGRLAARLERVERELARLAGAPVQPEPVPQQLTPAVEPSPPIDVAAIPEVVAVEPVYRRPRPPVHSADAEAIEDWIGRRGLGWAAVVLLLFATAFFLKYAFDNEWVGPLGRVSMGILSGAGLCVAGWRYRNPPWAPLTKAWLGGVHLFSQMLTAAGVVLLYLSTFGAFGYYHLIPREQAALYLIILIGEAAALALLYDAPAIALMAVIGGLLNPILLSTGIDQHQALFLYLICLNLGVLGLFLARSWRAVSTVALLGTQFLFWGWYHQHYHPEKLAATIGFQGALFVLFLAHSVVILARPQRQAHVEDLVRLVLNAFLFGSAGYVLLDEKYHVWMGSLSVGLAIAYTGLGWLLQRRRREDYWHVLVSAATALAFVAMAFPLQADAAWIGLGWAVEGLVLWWFGARIRSESLRTFAAALFAFAFCRLIFADTPWLGRPPFVPVFNKYALPALASALCFIGAALVSRRLRGLDQFERAIQVLTGLAGVFLVWLILSVDTYQFWIARIGRTHDPVTMQRTAQASLSAFWAVYAALILALGFRLRASPLRWAALGLFGLTLGKVFLVDMAGLPGFYRVIAFFVLSLMMGAAAWGYQKLDALSRAARTLREGQHEPVV